VHNWQTRWFSFDIKSSSLVYCVPLSRKRKGAIPLLAVDAVNRVNVNTISKKIHVQINCLTYLESYLR
jgi:hypothetical protein